ncbi:MAG: thiamine pyrophosphate-dependent enzyme [Bryobacteraceae bacterium]
MSKSNPSKPNKTDRRGFLRGAAGGAALAAQAASTAQTAQAQQPAGANQVPASPAPARVEVNTPTKFGGDFMVDVIKSLGFEYTFNNPASSVRGLHEAIINYGGNKDPEWLTCLHEEQSVAMAHGYAKISGKPVLVTAHGTVGLQHASMAIYNAWCDRVPVYIIIGTWDDATVRDGYVEWAHSVQDGAAIVREFTKWDDHPVSLQHFAESAVRAYKIMMTPPMEPVLLAVDAYLQEDPIKENNLRIPKLSTTSPPAGDPNAVNEAARLLVNAEYPLIMAGRSARTPKGIELLVELANLLGARVNDQRNRMNFPSTNVLSVGGNVADSDVILGLEVQDFFNSTHRNGRPQFKAGTKTITISALELSHKANYQDFGRYAESDIAIPADAEATLPWLIEACKKLMTGDRRRLVDERRAKAEEAYKRAHEVTRQQAVLGWNSSPLTPARVSAELWAQIKNEDWSLVSNDMFFSAWCRRLWNPEKHYHYIGGSAGEGIGYGIGAAVGAALANKKYGRLSVNIQNDGDLNYAPGALWTAAHHQIPLLTVMHNNRAYHQETMDIYTMAARANRGIDRGHIGTTIRDPNIDYANMAKTYGVYGIGPIENPNDLAPAIKKALEVVKKGEPALIDTVTQGR